MPPLGSPYFDDNSFETLHSEIRNYQAQGNVLLIGNVNARTESESDIVDSAGNSHIFRTSSVHLIPTSTKINSLDYTVNKNGKELVHLCRSLGLYMLNGRIRGVSLGRFTCCSALGTCVVDCAITDMDPSFISAFTVRPQSPLSDHCQINVYLKNNGQKIAKESEPCKTFRPNKIFKWAHDSDGIFKTAIGSPETTHLINNFLSKTFQPNQSGINLAVTQINKIYYKSANKAGLKKTREPKKKNGLIVEVSEKNSPTKNTTNHTMWKFVKTTLKH